MSEIHTGDAFEVLDQLEGNSIHAIVTDPPYGLAFMGRSWDDFEPKEYQEWCEKWAAKAMRVLKPGGHMLAFSGNRTHHRLFTGVEDAGFEIRDTITWHYGSGFPKALDVSKAIDKAADAEREEVGSKLHKATNGGDNGDYATGEQPITEPATDAAEKWDGWKTALKPATEYVVMARKPFDGTVAENVEKHGTGAMNIDGCRVESGERAKRVPTDHDSGGNDVYGQYENDTSRSDGTTTEGRYPANVVFGEQAAEQLDRDVGELHESTESTRGSGAIWGHMNDEDTGEKIAFGDSGGPSRYFYTSKATQAERTLDGRIDNAHPTVKPTDLMEWLVTLVTAENQIILDPFIGSGTTGMACKNTNRDFIGIEQNPEYADIARVRCGLTPDDPSVVRDSGEHGLEAFTDT